MPHNGIGYQQSHDGDGYAGCYFDAGGIYTEYIHVQLASPMIAGVTYDFSMYVVLHNFSETATDDIGAYFSVTAPSSSGVGYLSGNPVPQITNTPGNVITDTLNWTLISGEYMAAGGEEYLTIGHFKDDSLVTYIDLPYGTIGPYYYIDDVSVTSSAQVIFDASDTSVCEKFCIDFFDQSTNNPTSWQWDFPGGTPSSSTAQNPMQICYQTPGVYDVTLITTNASGNDTLILNDYVTVYATPAFPSITQNGFVLTCSPADSYQWQLDATDIPGATDQSFTVTQSGLYSVLVTNENGCQNSASQFVEITGIDLWQNADVSVYPNPAVNAIVIEVRNVLSSNEVSIQLMNSLGRTVYSSRDNISSLMWKKEIDVRSLARGMYLLEISSNNQVAIKKVEVE
jgi:PKD repeat protein